MDRSPFKQKIMAAASSEIDTFDMLDVTCKAFPMSFHKRERKDAEFVYKRAFSAAHLRLTPLLTRLVDEVEALKAVLEQIRDTPGLGGLDHRSTKKWRESSMAVIDSIAREALNAHQKRWEDLK